MFSDMDSLIELNLSSFDTSNVTDMSYMFTYMSDLVSLDLSSFNTINVVDFTEMFNGCYKLRTLIYGADFVYANNADVSYMFNDTPANKPTDPSWNGVV